MSEEHGPIWDHLQTCEHAVSAPSEEGIQACGRGACCRVSWDGGKEWLYLCERHMEDVQMKGDPDATAERLKP